MTTKLAAIIIYGVAIVGVNYGMACLGEPQAVWLMRDMLGWM